MGIARELIFNARLMDAIKTQDAKKLAQLQYEVERRAEYERRQDEAFEKIWQGVKDFFTA